MATSSEGGGELCRLVTCTVTDFDRVVSSTRGSIRPLSKSSTEEGERLKWTIAGHTYVEKRSMPLKQGKK